MRQILVKVPRGHGQEVLALAEEQDGVNLVQVQARDGKDPCDMVFINISNHNELVQIVETDLRFTRPSLSRQNTLLGVIYVQRQPNSLA